MNIAAEQVGELILMALLGTVVLIARISKPKSIIEEIEKNKEDIKIERTRKNN